VWPESLRVKGAGLLQSAWGAGYFLAAGIYLLFSQYTWRVMFFVGLIPALVAVLIRLRVREPERWQKAQLTEKRRRLTLVELFTPERRRDTVVGSALAFVAVFGLWGATNWTPSLIRELPGVQNLDESSAVRMVSYAVMSLNIGAIVGYLTFAPMAEWLGRRASFLVMMLGAAVMLPVTFLIPSSYFSVLVLLPALGFFSNGIFSGFPIYLPELYPTRIRATGSGFCFNIGRILAAGGPFLTGYLIIQLGTFARAASSIAVIYLVGVIVLAFARETKGVEIQ
jgi:MFS family permease